MIEPRRFIPFSGAHGTPRAARQVIWLDIRDNSMPHRNWMQYDRPPIERGFVSKRAPRVRAESAVPMLLQRQAS